MARRDWYSRPTPVHWFCRAPIDRPTSILKTELREANDRRLGVIVRKLRLVRSWPITDAYLGKQSLKYCWLPNECDWRKLWFPAPVERLLAGEV